MIRTVRTLTVSSLIVIACAGIGLFGFAAVAQEESGIYGSVRVPDSASGENLPVAEAVIAALDSQGAILARTTAAADGSYRLLLPAGIYRLTASHPDFAGFDTREAIIQVQGNHFTLFHIAMNRTTPAATPGNGLRGIVRQIDGTPVEGVDIAVSDNTGMEFARGKTDASGTFRFSLAAGSYRITAAHPRYEAPAPQTIVIGDVAPVDLVITLRGAEPLTGGIQGLVRARADGGSPGRPIHGAVLTATSLDGVRSATATSNEIGFYRIMLPPGQYRLAVAQPDYENTDSGENPVTVAADAMATWNALMVGRVPQSGTRTCRERFPVSIGASYGEKHVIYVRVQTAGVLTVSYRWTGDAPNLALIVRGPGGSPRRVDGRSPLSITTEVSADLIAQGTQWEITIANFGGGSGQGTLSVSYPCEN